MVAFFTTAEAQIEYNWQNSKGWVSASEPNLGCVLVAEPNALAMKAFNQTPVMRSGTLQDDLGIDATTYNRVKVSLKTQRLRKSQCSIVSLRAWNQYSDV